MDTSYGDSHFAPSVLLLLSVVGECGFVPLASDDVVEVVEIMVIHSDIMVKLATKVAFFFRIRKRRWREVGVGCVVADG